MIAVRALFLSHLDPEKERSHDHVERAWRNRGTNIPASLPAGEESGVVSDSQGPGRAVGAAAPGRQRFTDPNEETDVMAQPSSDPRDQHGIHRIHEGDVVRVSTSQVPRPSLRQLTRPAMAIVGVITLAAWLRQDSPTSTEPLVRTDPGRLTAMALSAAGGWLATGGYHGPVLIWDVARRRVETELVGTGGPVSALACSPDGSILAAARLDGTVTVWETSSWEIRREFRA